MTGVPIPLIELQRYESMSKTVPIVPGQFEDADMATDERRRNISESESVATETEEQEAARSLLILSGSGSESDLTTALTNSRKTSTVTNEDIRNSPSETRKVSVIDRRVSQQVIDEQQRRVSQVIDIEHQKRISQHVLDAEQQRRLSQQVDQTIKSTEMPELHVLPGIMQPPNEVPIAPPPPLMPSPRKLSPIEQLQQQVQQQQHLLQTTWTPNCDSLSRPRSYSFNDLPLNSNVFPSTSCIPIEPLEPISDESSGDSLDSFTSRDFRCLLSLTIDGILKLNHRNS